MSENLERLWDKVKDLKHDANRLTDNTNIHGLINDLIDEIEIAMDSATCYESGEYGVEFDNAADITDDLSYI
jgi:hypothetical protein